MPPNPLKVLIESLQIFYGVPSPPAVTDPYQMIIWENASYLVDERRQAQVFNQLRDSLGLEPEALLSVPPGQLAEIIQQGGMHPERRASKLRSCASLALETGLDRLRRMVRESPQQACKALRKFPRIGEPGADKILLFAESKQCLAPDSNGLRVLTRFGLGSGMKNYGQTYRSAAQAVEPLLPDDFPWLIRARHLLRQHGKELCKRSAPLCLDCPVQGDCFWCKAT